MEKSSCDLLHPGELKISKVNMDPLLDSGSIRNAFIKPKISNEKHRLPTHVQVPKSGTCRSCRDNRECVQVVGVWKMMVKLI